jgi:hypothetical protein
MEIENSGYKVGDWVLLEDSFIQKALNRNADKIIIKLYSSPQKIQAIYKDKSLKKEILEFSPIRKWMLRENEFRYATKKELKELKIKSIFLKILI